MLIRLRFVAGDRARRRTRSSAGSARSSGGARSSPTRSRAVRAMKRRIEDERLEAGRDLEADLKEGPGGIRDVEFLVQAFQLFFGGREPALRTGNVLARARRARAAGPARTRRSPTRSATRTCGCVAPSTRVQMVEERQTQAFPRDAARAARAGAAHGLRRARGPARARRAARRLDARARGGAHALREPGAREQRCRCRLERALEAALARLAAAPRLANARRAARRAARPGRRGDAQLDGAPLRGARPRAGRERRVGALPRRSRPALLARLAALEPGCAASGARRARRRVELPDPASALEDFLDALRLLRRDEMLFAACLQLGGARVASTRSPTSSRCSPRLCCERALAAAEGARAGECSACSRCSAWASSPAASSPTTPTST